MPLYDYKCDGCGHAFEINQSMNDAPVRVCPSCGAEHVRKVLTTGGIMGSTKMGQGGGSMPPPCAGGGCSGGMCGLN
ncbi:MAG: zinc ribbon domain-containing protein [Magnetococcus sp. WYHC-3]